MLFFTIASCGTIAFEQGEYFNTSIWVTGNSAWYDYAGTYDGMSLYTSKFAFQEYHSDAGLLVKDDKVYKILSVNDVVQIQLERSKKIDQVQSKPAKTISTKVGGKTMKESDMPPANQSNITIINRTAR